MANKYDMVIDTFKVYYPGLSDEVVEWWGSGRTTIFIMFKDGSLAEYNQYDNTLRNVNVSEYNEPSAKSIGYNLQKIIQLSGMTQSEVANKVGITNAMLSRYIHGTAMPSADKVYKIARVLGRSVDEIFDGHYLALKEN